jgi:thiamine kinase-like enzyme
LTAIGQKIRDCLLYFSCALADFFFFESYYIGVFPLYQKFGGGLFFMMYFSIDNYLCEHKAEKINIGMSGADVYVIDNTYILKHIVLNKLKNRELFFSYKKEAQFYQAVDIKNLNCLPEVISIKESDDEIIILMKKYRMVGHANVNQTVLSKIMKALAMVHHYQPPEFLLQNRSDLMPLTDEQIINCINGWKCVLSEHKGLFDEKPIDKIAASINSIVLWHASGEDNLIHGDFHLNNLLFDDEEEIVICDWQNVSIGDPSNDLSFFLSRFNADGFNISERVLIGLYSKAVYELYGKTIDSDAIYSHMAANTLITSFLYWHEYLHGASEERVKKVYEKMAQIISDDLFPRTDGF